MCGGPQSATAPIRENAQAVRSAREISIRRSFCAMKPSRGRLQWNTKGERADHETVHRKSPHSLERPERAPVPGGKRTVGMSQSLDSFCRQYGRLNLLNEWDTERNLPLTPETVTHGAHHKIWWRCSKGHEWQAPVYARTAGAGCPYCAGKKVQPGSNDLASQYPALVKEWDTEKNLPALPTTISAGSKRLVWWKCAQGHSWRAQIRSRVSGCGCPVCAGRLVIPGENDLASLYPKLAQEWDREKNGPLTPEQVPAGTARKAWWRCKKGHSWRAAIAQRAGQGAGCPVCAGQTVVPGENDFASFYPGLAQEWDSERNGGLTPDRVTPSSNRKVWWRCPLGHHYMAIVASRTISGSGCPYCANRRVLPGFNDLATLVPEVAKQWHPTLNGALTPQMVLPGSHRKVWWQCSLGHVWKACIYSRAGSQRCGCPICAGKGNRKDVRYEEILAESAEMLSAVKSKAGAQMI